MATKPTTSEEAIKRFKDRVVNMLVNVPPQLELQGVRPCKREEAQKIIDTLVGDEKNYILMFARLAYICGGIESVVQSFENDDTVIAIPL